MVNIFELTIGGIPLFLFYTQMFHIIQFIVLPVLGALEHKYLQGAFYFAIGFFPVIVNKLGVIIAYIYLCVLSNLTLCVLYTISLNIDDLDKDLTVTCIIFLCVTSVNSVVFIYGLCQRIRRVVRIRHTDNASRQIRNVRTKLPPALTLYRINTNEGRCTICLDDYSDDNPGDFMMGCGHIFHQRCIESWLKQNKQCPNCRQTL